LTRAELGNVSQSAKDISTLQQNLKEKEKTIDKMKAAGSSFKSTLSSAQQKMKELEAEKVSLNKKPQASHGRLQKFESFTVQQLELDENSM
jgi:septal ring factor EnvC (AmiA/AmiB activator)